MVSVSMSGPAKAQAKAPGLWVASLVAPSEALWEAQKEALWVRRSAPALAGPRVYQLATSTVVEWAESWGRPATSTVVEWVESWGRPLAT
jgi:hypothetical protein